MYRLNTLPDVFFNPNKAFDNLKLEPNYLFPLLIIMVLKIALVVVYYYQVDYAWMVDKVIDSIPADISADQQNVLRSKLSMVGVGGLTVLEVVSTFFKTFLMFICLTGYLILVSSLFGVVNRISFDQYFSIVSWSLLVTLIGTLAAFSNLAITNGGQISFDKLNTLTLKNLFFPEENLSILKTLIGTMDIGFIWALIILSFGYASLTGVSLQKSFVRVFAPFIALLLIFIL